MKHKVKQSIATICVHAGERTKIRSNRPLTIPIEQTATYYWETTQQIEGFYRGKVKAIKYGRYGNSTQQALEEKIAELEGADMALAFASGMNALTTAILALVKKGDHILYINDCYRNSSKFFEKVISSFGIEATAVSPDNINNLESYIQNDSRLFFAEIPTNPFLRVIDLKRVVKICKRRKLVAFIDSSFASPMNLRPLDYGADLVMHSATKYLGGHNDLFAGVIAGKLNLMEMVQEKRNILGGILAPMDAFLLLRSLKTLPVRMKQLNTNGLLVANYLEKHPLVKKVYYPGLSSHSDYKIAKEQLLGFGSVITFLLRATEKQTSEFVDNLSLIYNASNFGGVESVIEQHAVLTFFNDREAAQKRGITGNLLRLSVGLEDPVDIINDLEQSFKKITKQKRR